MQFVLMFLVPGTSILRRRDLARLVVFDVGSPGRAVGLVAVLLPSSESLLHFGAERHARGPWTNGRQRDEDWTDGVHQKTDK